MDGFASWEDVTMDVGTFNSDTYNDEFTIITGRCSACKCYAYSLCQYSPIMPMFCCNCGRRMLNGDSITNVINGGVL